MASSHGKDGVFKLDNNGGSLQTLTTHTDGFALEQSVESDRSDTLGVRFEQHTYGLRDNGSIPIGGPYNETIHAHIMGLKNKSATSSFENHPSGTVTPQAKQSGECRLVSYSVEVDLPSTVRYSSELKVSGAVTDGNN